MSRAIRPPLGKVLRYPSPFLTQPTVPWNFREDDPDELLLLGEYLGRFTPNHGLALAANQIGSDVRAFLVRNDRVCTDLLPLVVNPEWAPAEDDKETEDEGCLSFPGYSLEIPRYRSIDAWGFGVDGKSFSVRLTGLDARVFQHECEHLDGKLFTDNVGRIQRFQVLGAMRRKR